MNAYALTQNELYTLGVEMANEFLLKNNIPAIKYRAGALPIAGRRPQGNYGCGHYLPSQRLVWVDPGACAKPSQGFAQQWSFPAYKTDRTPVGVVAHEVGHATDHLLDSPSRSPRWKEIVFTLKKEKMSSYEPSLSEAFAETMRLFITNPSFLDCVAPTRYAYLVETVGLTPRVRAQTYPIAELRLWGASEAIIQAATNKVYNFRRRHA